MSTHLRQLPLALTIMDVDDKKDGRTVYGRIVPYGETIPFLDEFDGHKLKHERFERGALAPQVRGENWSRVTLAFEHQPGFGNTIGYGRRVEEREDGAYASFRLYEPDAVRARAMITESHKGLSLEFESRDAGQDGPVVVRKLVHVYRVGIVPDPAYMGAQVLAVRHATWPAPLDTMDDRTAADSPTPHLDALREYLKGLTP